MAANKPLKIAMLGHKRIPSREGGVEIVVEKLATRMAALGHIITCYNRSGHHVSGQEYDTLLLKEYKGVGLKQVFTINGKGLAAVTASFFAAIRAAFSDADIVHFHAEGPCVMLWLPKLFGKRCIATIHGLDHKRAKWGAFAKFYIMLGEKVAVKYADEIIVLSKSVQEYFQATYGRATRLIPNGVNRPEHREPWLITEKYGLRKDEYILFLGRLVPEKGIHYLIKAFKQLVTKKKLVIAGGKSDTDAYVKQLEELAQGDGRIIFTGFVQGQLLEELYSNAFLYTLPSDLEGMPLSLLEAMSYGNYCLTSDIPECAAILSGRGVTFKKGDVEDLQLKLQELCNNPIAVASNKAKDTASFYVTYDWDRITEATLSLYKGE